jgi:hypothetical protein
VLPARWSNIEKWVWAPIRAIDIPRIFRSRKGRHGPTSLMDRGCTQTERDIAPATFLQDQAQDDGVRLHVILSNPLYTDCAIIFDAMARAKKSTLHHSALVPVPGYQASKARWALQPRGQAVLFVHGFNGTSVGTWKGFDEILPLEPRARGLDLLFYGYDSWLTDIRSSGRKLFRLMQTLQLTMEVSPLLR